MSRPKQYPISAKIKSCAALRGNEKALLIEICTMFTVGTRKVCDAKNQHFVDALAIDKDTVGRVLGRLEAKGYVSVDPGKERGNRRTITPTTLALSLYLSAAEIVALSAENEVISPIDDLVGAIDDFAGILSTICGETIDFSSIALSTIRRLTIDDSSLLLLIVKEFTLNLKERGRNAHTQKKKWWEGNKKKEAPPEDFAVPEAGDGVVTVLPYQPDLSKPADEFGQWQAIPENVEMVDAYLTRINHEFAGYGFDFFNFYNARDWRVGAHQMRCANWKSLLARWKFEDVKKQLAAGGSQVQKRVSMVENIMRNTEFNPDGSFKE